VISSMHRRIIELVADIKEYASIVAMRPDIVNVQGGIQPPIRGQIEFHNVSFNYTRATSTTLRDVSRRETWNPGVQNVNIHIKSGERVAFVGCSGAGKTTLASLLLRAYDPDQGTIRIDGHDLKSLDLSHYRRSIGVVEQQVTLFDNSIVYNILMGVPEGRPFTQQDINVALRTSYLHPFVVSLEQGLNTLVGENGKRLSGGQCQRIAIARALICPRSILIFDESTAHIDPQTESLVVDAIDQHAPNSTCIFIAHRLSLMTRVQRIYVFDKGELVGVGHHDELLATCSKYRELVREQENYTHTSHTILENRYADDNGFTSLSEMEREHRPIMCAILGGLKNLRARKFSQEITLLDLGCGNGALLRSVSRQAPGVHCFGIDIDPEKIERGRTLLGVPQVYLAQGNICNPSDEWFTTPKFDIVLVNAAFLVLPGNERLWSWLGRHADLIYAYAYVADGNREWAAISACSDVGVRLEIMEPVIAGETMVWIASRVGNCEVNSNLVQYGQLTNEI
jgi:ABC-type multidrug transport system ATPase subunit